MLSAGCMVRYNDQAKKVAGIVFTPRGARLHDPDRLGILARIEPTDDDNGYMAYVHWFDEDDVYMINSCWIEEAT